MTDNSSTKNSTDLSTGWKRLLGSLREALWAAWFPPFADGGQAARPGGLAQLGVTLAWPLLRIISLLTPPLSRRRLCQQRLALGITGAELLAVGNWLPGGTGKTPTVMGLAAELRQRGLRVGIVSRGCGRQGTQTLVLQPAMLGRLSPADTGDEPWLMCLRSGVPVAVGPNRREAAERLMAEQPVDWILLDDGLSQTHLRPDLRLLLIDDRGLGSRLPLPAGPLRIGWPPPSAACPDRILLRQSQLGEALSPAQAAARHDIEQRCPNTKKALSIAIQATGWSRLDRWPPELLPRAAPCASLKTLVVSGIARPQRFEADLRQRVPGLEILGATHLSDHASGLLASADALRRRHDLSLESDQWQLLLTEKDLVKLAWEARDAGVYAEWMAHAAALQQTAVFCADTQSWIDQLTCRPHGHDS